MSLLLAYQGDTFGSACYVRIVKKSEKLTIIALTDKV